MHRERPYRHPCNGPGNAGDQRPRTAPLRKRTNALTQVLFITGHSSLDALSDALELGATDYLLKPWIRPNSSNSSNRRRSACNAGGKLWRARSTLAESGSPPPPLKKGARLPSRVPPRDSGNCVSRCSSKPTQPDTLRSAGVPCGSLPAGSPRAWIWRVGGRRPDWRRPPLSDRG